MNKTIFNFNLKISTILISSFGVLLGFLANAFYTNNFFGLIFFIIRSCLFVGIYLCVYFLEKNNFDFKNKCKRMVGYLIWCYLLNLLCSIFALTHILQGVFLTVSGVICFWTIASFILEILYLYFDKKWLSKIISVNEKIGLTIANPIVKIIETKTTNG